jgi:hypothetical protein
MGARRKVLDFMRDFRKACSKGLVTTTDCRKNRDALSQLGITERQRLEEISTLSVNDYCGIASERVDGEGICHIFGKEVCGSLVYIKLKLEERNGVTFARFVSFHPPEGRMRFPFRRSEDE